MFPANDQNHWGGHNAMFKLLSLWAKKTMWHHELKTMWITRTYYKTKTPCVKPTKWIPTEHTDLFPLSPKTGFSSGSKANWRPAEVRKGCVAMVRCQEFPAVCLVAKIAIYNLIILLTEMAVPSKFLTSEWLVECLSAKSFPYTSYIIVVVNHGKSSIFTGKYPPHHPQSSASKGM